MYRVPENWDNLLARFHFFEALPRPLAVLIACDLASLAPQRDEGRRAIDAARNWLVQQEKDERLLQFFQAALPTASSLMKRPDVVTDFAAACAVAVASAQRDSALAAALTADAAARCGGEAAAFERQRRLVQSVVQAASGDTVRQLLRAAETDPTARPIFWDAMHDAGYAPTPTRP